MTTPDRTDDWSTAATIREALRQLAISLFVIWILFGHSITKWVLG